MKKYFIYQKNWANGGESSFTGDTFTDENVARQCCNFLNQFEFRNLYYYKEIDIKREKDYTSVEEFKKEKKDEIYKEIEYRKQYSTFSIAFTKYDQRGDYSLSELEDMLTKLEQKERITCKGAQITKRDIALIKNKIESIKSMFESMFQTLEESVKVVGNNSDRNDKKSLKTNESKKYFHSKFAPSSQGVKSRKPIEDDFELTM